MSAGSNNIVVQITDQVDPTIAPKIRDIANAARDANSYLNVLQTSLNDLGGGSQKLSQALQAVKPALDDATVGTGRLEGAIAQLAGRVVGAEAGFGMLGGALARVGVAAGIAGPLIVGALAIGAVVGAILLYNKFNEIALKLAEAQTAVAKASNESETRLLQQEETLTGLTSGPLAKYQQELADLPFKSINIDVGALNKLLSEQDTFWDKSARLIGAAKDALIGYATAGVIGASLAISTYAGATTSNDVTRFIADQERIRQAGATTRNLLAEQESGIVTDAKQYAEAREQNNYAALLTDLQNTKKYVADRDAELRASVTTEQPFGSKAAREALEATRSYQTQLLDEQASYLQKRQTLQEGADGAYISEIKKAAQAELAAYKEQFSQLKENNNGVDSPQQSLSLSQTQLNDFLTKHPGADQTNPSAQLAPWHAVYDALIKDVGNYTQSVARQNRELDEYVQKQANALVSAGAFDAELKAQADAQKNLTEIQRIAPDNPRAQEALIQANAIDASKEALAKYNEELKKLDAASDAERFKTLIAALQANASEFENSRESAERYSGTFALLNRVYNDATIPLNTINRDIANQTELFGKYGIALAVATQIQKDREELLLKDHVLSTEEEADLTRRLLLLNEQKAVEANVNTLYGQNAGAVQKLEQYQTALNEAVQKGTIGRQEYNRLTVETTVALANQALQTQDNVTLLQQLISLLGALGTQGKSVATELTDIYKQVGTQLENGIAMSLAKAATGAENLGKALRNVAQQTLQTLIAAMIKLGIQLLVNITRAAILDALTGGGAAVANGASPAANSQANAAYIGSRGGLVPSYFDLGGPVYGPTGTDTVPAWLTPGEFIMNRQATAANLGLLQFINSGAASVRANGASPSYGSKMEVNVIHDGSTGVSVEQLDDNRVRIIAQQEAKNSVHTQTPLIIASELQNPNSRSSKALRQNYLIKRSR